MIVRRAFWFGLGAALLLLSLKVLGQCLVPMPLFGAPSAAEEASDITLYGEIDEAMAVAVVGKIHAANKIKTDKPILIYINSPGGDILSGGIILDAMRASRRTMTTIDVSLAASMGAIIFEHGEKRLMLPRSILMFHEANAATRGDLSHLDSQITLYRKIMERYEMAVAKRANITIDTLRSHEASQWWLLADEAVLAHLADEVADLSDYPVN